jgi:hypothetical protein
MAARVELKRSTPVEFVYRNASGDEVTFTVPACTVGGYREATRIESEEAASTNRLLDQAIALCGAACRPHLEALEVEMLQEVIQAQVALYSGLNPEVTLTVLRAVKKKALAEVLANSSPVATS